MPQFLRLLASLMHQALFVRDTDRVKGVDCCIAADAHGASKVLRRCASALTAVTVTCHSHTCHCACQHRITRQSAMGRFVCGGSCEMSWTLGLRREPDYGASVVNVPLYCNWHVLSSLKATRLPGTHFEEIEVEVTL